MLPQAQRRPNGVACTPCRRSKMKCVTSDSASPTCDRCERLQRHCVFESHRRGLWRRDVTGRREEQTRPPDDNPTDLSPVTPQRMHYTPGSPSEQSFTFQRHPLQSRPSGSISASSRSDHSTFSPASLVTSYQDTRGLSFGTIIHPNRPVDDESSSHSDILAQDLQQTGYALTPQDPIDMGLLSRPSAQNLYEGFLQHFNSLVGLLDPDLYTFSYTRSRSNLLFTMILTISSRVFQPESHPPIRDHAESLLGRALLACDSAVENIWAIICLYHWKDTNDTRGYTLIGFARSMAASAEWNMTCHGVSYEAEGLDESTELQVRQKRDKHRIWLTLGNIDRMCSYFTDRPLLTTITLDYVTSRDWLSSRVGTYPLGDRNAVAGHELTLITQNVYKSMIKTRINSTAPSESTTEFDAFRNDIVNFNHKITAWGEYWLPNFSTFPIPESFQPSLICLFKDYTRLYFNSVLLHRILVSENRPFSSDEINHTTSICYLSALSILRQAIEMCEMDIIYYLWDAAHLMIAYAAMMVLKLIIQDVDESIILRKEAFTTVAQVSTAYDTAAKSMAYSGSSLCEASTNSVAVQARLLSAIVRRLRRDSVQPDIGPTTQEMSDDPSGSSIRWIEDQLNRSMLFSNRIIQTPEDYVDLHTQAFRMPDELDTFIPGTHQRLDLMLDDDFVKSKYVDMGLLTWDESGIFIQPH